MEVLLDNIPLKSTILAVARRFNWLVSGKTYLYLTCFILVMNIRSFPLVWHYHVLKHVWRLRASYWLFRMRLIGKPNLKNAKARWLESIAPIGADPWSWVLKTKGFAGPDDCDFNMHLSNSSYSKVLDAVRMNVLTDHIPTHFESGTWAYMGATHYSFIREIPIFSSYDIRTNVATWDDKWLYVVTRFVTPPKSKKRRQDRSHANTAPVPTTTLLTPAAGDSLPENNNNTTSTTAIKESVLRKEEPDGSTLHCISVSEIVFKIDRITVPPAIVLALSGYSAASPMNGESYSRGNPPPHMDKIRYLLERPKELKAFMRGGWRDLPAEDRWWEQALDGAVEEKRKITLELMQGLRRGMEGVKAVC